MTLVPHAGARPRSRTGPKWEFGNGSDIQRRGELVFGKFLRQNSNEFITQRFVNSEDILTSKLDFNWNAKEFLFERRKKLGRVTKKLDKVEDFHATIGFDDKKCSASRINYEDGKIVAKGDFRGEIVDEAKFRAALDELLDDFNLH